MRGGSVFLVLSLLIVSFFSVGSAAETDTKITFDADVAGITPDKWYYFLDFTHTEDEAIAEAGLMAQKGDVEGVGKAMENFADAIDSQDFNLENVDLEGITVEGLKSDESFQAVYETQADLSNYQLQIDSINSILSEQGEEWSSVEKAVAPAEESLANIGSVVEEKTTEAIETAAENSNVATIEASFEIEEGFRGVAGERYPETSPRFKEISDIQDVSEIKVKINQLRDEVKSLEESGDSEKAKVAKDLLDMAESHGVICLHASEQELGITADIHLNAAEDFLAAAEDLIGGEVEVSEIATEVEDAQLTTDEIVAEISDEQKDAEVFAENYDGLKEKYSDDPLKLAILDAENGRLQQVELLGKALEENEVIEKWKSELIAEGVSEGEEMDARINERLTNELNLAANGETYVPAGVYVLPGDDGTINKKSDDQEIEEIPIGRVDIYEVFNPETGVYERKIAGWVDGKEIEDPVEGGGYALGVEYKDPSTEYTYSFGSQGYSYTTPAGVVYTQEYPADYTPGEKYENGDESKSYTTESGDVITYSAVGYEITDAESGEVLEEEAYVNDVITFSGGETSNNDATGYFFSNDKGEATVYVYNPETDSFTDTIDGKVFVPETPSLHQEFTDYNPETGNYEMPYAGDVWSNDGSGTWTSPTGEKFSYNVVPAPIGYEEAGTWTTQRGETWTYNSETNTWSNSVTGSSYTPSPNNYYRYTDSGHFTDTRGNKLAPVGTEYTDPVDGKTYRVDGSLGWSTTDENGNKIAVAPPAGQPSSATGFGTGSYASVWGYNSVSKQWISSDTGYTYDSLTGVITRPDGTTSSPQDEASKQGSEGAPCYGCYYVYGAPTDSDEWAGPKAYTYDSGGSYKMNPVSGQYYYVSGAGESQYGGDSSGKTADGIKWSLQGDTWVGTKTDGTTITGSEYASQQAASRGAEARSPVGTMVQGDDGRTYTVTADRGWTDDSGKAVSPPTVGGSQMPSSATSGGGYYGGYSGGYYGGGYGSGAYGGYAQAGGYPSGGYYGGYYSAPAGGYTAEMDAAAQAAGYSDAASAAAAYASSSGGYYSGGYAGGPGSSYPGASSSGGGYYGGGYDSSGSYVGGSYGGYDSSGGYVGTGYSGGSYSSDGSYSGGSYSGGSYSGGSYSGGSYSGGDSGSYSGGSTGGDSGGSTSSGGDSGGSTGGGDSGGSTGAVIADVKKVDSEKVITKKSNGFNSFREMFCKGLN